MYLNKVLGMLAVTSAVAVGGEGCTGGEPKPGQDQLCTVEVREINSKGREYIGVECTPGSKSAVVVEGPHQWPKCQSGAVWPSCKDA